MVTFDDLLEETGSFGRCQKRVFLLLCVLSLPFTTVYAAIVFQGFTPDHWCRDAGADNWGRGCRLSPEDGRRATLPTVNVSGEPRWSSCQRYDLDWNQTGLTCDLSSLNLSATTTTACMSGWEYQDEGRKSLVTEFHLVCSDSWLLDLYQSALNLGFLLSSFTFGYFADRFGRRMGIFVSNVLSAISAIALTVAPNYGLVLLFRFLLGFSIKGGWMTAYVLLTEIVGVAYRRTVGILYQMVFSVGILLLPLLAFLIKDWRWLHTATTMPYFFFLSYYWLIPESPRWLASQNFSKAREVMAAMAKENKQELTSAFEALTDCNCSDSPSGSLLDLFRTPKMRKYTFILMFNWFSSAMVYQGLIMRVGITGGNIYLDFLISGLVEFPAAFIILVTIERVGRRLPFAAANIVAGASCLVAAFIPDSIYWLKTAVACIGRLGITMAFEMVIFVNTELYPTFVRNLGVSVCSTLCDIGGIVAPFLLYRLSALWAELPLVIFGGVALMGGGLIMLLPETRGLPLPETVQEVEFPHRNPKLYFENLCMKKLPEFDPTNQKPAN